ncbi:hypothetical protein F4680DRAFT_7816 [Xylaria scruposa]|nr:hypothetical protein F4680DRAFT_7816 [Xylaria scruposa]
MMDKDWKDALFEGWDDSTIVLGKRDSDVTRLTDPSPLKTTPNNDTRDGENTSLKVESSKGKGEGGSDSKTGMRTEPPSPQPRTLLKKRPTSTRPSVEIFQSSMMMGDDDDEDNNNNDDKNDDGDDDSKSKQSRASVDDNSSVDTIGSNDERRLSDKVRKAWRGVTGQRLADPLEQWMVKHSGGTLREVSMRRPPRRESSDKQ